MIPRNKKTFQMQVYFNRHDAEMSRLIYTKL